MTPIYISAQTHDLSYVETCTQAGNLFRLMNSGERGRLVSSIIASSKSVPQPIQERQSRISYEADPRYGTSIAQGAAGMKPLLLTALKDGIILSVRPTVNMTWPNMYLAKKFGMEMSERTYQGSSYANCSKNEFLYHSPSADVFFVNITYMFNGNRITLAKSYYLKDQAQQPELPLEQSKEIRKLNQ